MICVVCSAVRLRIPWGNDFKLEHLFICNCESKVRCCISSGREIKPLQL
ncbi:hypothetical protein F383_35184 [Gossypium arboreum]|uniref:Uncharacterized protein n=1 Tax=Gossypium arboreum TaxID=29729 RepID=A0A0B0N8W9_GOSAR|nr:hypothetical protein F383_35184 [Gossypium arboreum]